MIITVNKKGKKAISINEQIFLTHLKETGIRNSDKPVESIIANFRSGRTHHNLLDLNKIKTFLVFCQKC